MIAPPRRAAFLRRTPRGFCVPVRRDAGRKMRLRPQESAREDT
jgi:hypothetical protein